MKAWTLKYRPKKIQDLNHKQVRNQLERFLKAGKIPQVLLFAGPKGIGKTSASRIIAAVLNDKKNQVAVAATYFQSAKNPQPLKEPDSTDPFIQKILEGNSFVVQELDAASNRGINEVRALKDRLLLPPVEGSMAVYILDEAHMLTTPAFNALLKMMEEPPPHVVFILATTELNKIPETVTSRCQILRFSKANREEILEALTPIIEQEKIKLDNDTLNKIADLADGSFRDAVKFLEQISLNQQAEPKGANLTLFPSVESEIKELLLKIVAKDAKAVCQIFNRLRQLKVDENYFITQLLKFLHSNLLQNLELAEGKPLLSQAVALFLLKTFNQPLNNQEGYIPLLAPEILALEVIEKAQRKNGSSPQNKAANKKTDEVSKPLPENNDQLSPNTSVILDENESIKLNPNPSEISSQVLGDGHKLMAQWDEFVSKVGHINAKLATLFCSIKPVIAEKNKITLGVYYKFHQEQLMQPQVINLIEEVASDISGGLIQFEFQLETNATQPALDINKALIS